MGHNCQMVVFSNRAYNAIIRESFYKDPVETGGILLGHILDNGVWIVMEVLPPGINSIFQVAYFEYDDAFVNYLAQSVSNQYKIPLSLLGLWHRHPGGMDYFSSTDDGTNATFASLNERGAISGLVNIDPNFRFTLRHVINSFGTKPNYEIVEFEVGDDIIPNEYFEYRYFNSVEKDSLHPSLACNLEKRDKKKIDVTNVNSNEHCVTCREQKRNYIKRLKFKYLVIIGLLVFILVGLLWSKYNVTDRIRHCIDSIGGFVCHVFDSKINGSDFVIGGMSDEQKKSSDGMLDSIPISKNLQNGQVNSVVEQHESPVLDSLSTL